MATETEILTAVLAAANTALPTGRDAYEPGKVPTPRPNEFVTVTIARRGGGSARAGRFATTGWAVYVMGASMTASSNARDSLRLVDGALDGVVLAIADETTTPIRFDNARPVAPDDGWFTGVNTYHFAI